MAALNTMFKNYSSVFWAATLGLTLTVLAAQGSVSFEEDFFQQTFNQRADNHTAAIEQGLKLVQIQGRQLLNQIRTELVIEESGEFSARDFKIMAAQFRTDFPVFKDFLWLNRQQSQDLTQIFPVDVSDASLFINFEQSSLFETSSGLDTKLYQLLEGVLVKAFAQPHEVMVVLHDAEGSAFHVLPLFDRLENGQDSTILVGVLLIHWHLGEAVESAIASFPKSGLDFGLSHWDLGKQDMFVEYIHTSRTRTGDDTESNRVFTHHNSFEMLDDRWFISYQSAPSFIQKHPLTMVWTTLIAGIVMTLLICSIVLLLARRNFAVEQLVAQKTAELQESEERFKQMIEHMPVGIAVHKDGIIQYLNPFFLNIIGGIELDAVIGERVLKFVHPDDHAAVVADGEGAVRADDVQHIPVRYVSPDGGQVHEMLASRTSIITDGAPVSVTIALDVTEQNQAQRALQIQYQTLQAVLDTSPVGIWMVNAQGKITLVNQAFARAVNSSETALKEVEHYQDVLSAEISTQTLASDAACLQQHGLHRDEERYTDVLGVQRVFEVIKVPLYGDADELLGLVGICVDITARLTAESAQEAVQRKAEEAQHLESLGVLAGGIAHDFNNLLSVILGNAALASKRLDDHSPLEPYLGRIEHASEKAADLCRQMLAYAGKGQFLMKQMDLSEVVQDMSRLLQVSLHKHVHVEYALATDLHVVEVDSAQIQQVIMNLITNANEAMDDHMGKVYIKTSMLHIGEQGLPHVVGNEVVQAGDYVYIEVRDEGCGMDEETQSRIFEPFFTTKFTGRGLGMSAMLGMVRSHAGLIQVQSSLGQGSVFRVYFPAVENQDVLDVEEVVAHIDWQGSGKILIIDDEEDVLETVDLMLQDFGFDVLRAKDGVQGLEIYQQYPEKIDLVLMDMTMPRMNGKQCTTEILKLNPQAKVILCSGYSEEEAELQFQGLQLAGFLQKPFHPDKLQITVEKALGSTSAD